MTSEAPRASEPQTSYSSGLQTFVFMLFFAFGGITSLNDVIIPKLKALFVLSYSEAMLVQSAFFAAYFVVSIPAAKLVRRIGYMRAAVVGLLTMSIGGMLFLPASLEGSFAFFLSALFVLAGGITIVQVVANPLISLLGPPSTVSSRLTFAQAFNSLGTTVFPYVGSILILGSLASVNPAALSGSALSASRSTQTMMVVHTYLGISIALAALAALVWSKRTQLLEAAAPSFSVLRAFSLLRRARFGFGTLCIFLYVGGEVAIGSLIVSYLMEHSTLGLSAEQAGKHVPLYWGGAMLGRFAGAYLLRIWPPAKVLAAAAAAAALLLLISANATGNVAAWSLLAVGLFNSIMFPTIFSLANDGLGQRAAEGSGVICVAIVGGAIVPLMAGAVADHWGLHAALIVPAICYGCILTFGLSVRITGRATALAVSTG